MPAYRLELIPANGQFAQTLAFFSLDDVQALAWGCRTMEFVLHRTYRAAEVWEDNRLSANWTRDDASYQ